MTSSRFRTEKPAPRHEHRRFVFIRAAVFIAFLFLFTRLVYVQAFLNTDLKSRADRQVKGIAETGFKRYRLLDRNGITLAETVQVESCYVDPRMVEKAEDVAGFLGSTLGLDKKSLLSDIRRTKGSFLWVRRSVALELVPLIKEKKLAGVGFKKEWRRRYPQGVRASHLMGFVGYDGTGLSGLERQYERVLSPETSSEQKSNDLPKGNVQLTIDAAIQENVERELEWGVTQTKSKHGMAIVQNPKTGEILALAYWPPMLLMPEKPPAAKDLRVPPSTDVFEPGSTFKVVTAAAALEERAVSLKEKFSGENGKWPVKDITLHDHEPRGLMTLQDIMTYSSNIGCAKIAERLGNERLYQYARLMGFGVFPGSGLDGEAKGLLRAPAQWSGVSKYVISFGQEVGVTGLQLIGAYSAIANSGELMEPRLVKGIVSDKSESLWSSTPMMVRRVFSTETAATLTKILVNVVTQGTGQMAQMRFMVDQRVAGKTGTAQKIDTKTHSYHANLTLLSFCGFFPAEAPRYTILVVLDEPEGRRWGGTDAAPVFRRIAEQLVTMEGRS